MVVFDTAQVLSIVIGVVLPLIVGLVTKASWPGSWKAVLLLALSALSGFLTELYDAVSANAAFDYGSAILGFVATFLTGVGMHFGLYKPVGATAAVQRTGVTDKVALE